MASYTYRGINKDGMTVSGIMEAQDIPGLEEKLRSIGYWLIEAAPERKGMTKLGLMALWSKINRQDLISVYTLLSFQVKAGVPLIQAIEVATDECENPRLRYVLEGIHRSIEAGSMLYESMQNYPEAFAPHVISLVRAGELSGKLPETFAELRRYTEWLERVMADIRQASIYPAIIFCVVGTFVLILFTFVIPKFVTLLESTKATLPAVTVVVFGISNFVKATWWIWFFGLTFGFAFIKAGRRLSRRFAYQFDKMRLSLPALGELNQMIALSRFSHNLAVMYRSGIPILQALHLCRGLVGNVVVENAVHDVERGVAGGETISEAMDRQKVFSAMVIRMVVLGESTGNLDDALENVSSYYNEIIPRRIKKIFALMEPMLMIILIGIVGTVAMAIFLPMLSLMSAIQ